MSTHWDGASSGRVRMRHRGRVLDTEARHETGSYRPGECLIVQAGWLPGDAGPTRMGACLPGSTPTAHC